MKFVLIKGILLEFAFLWSLDQLVRKLVAVLEHFRMSMLNLLLCTTRRWNSKKFECSPKRVLSSELKFVEESSVLMNSSLYLNNGNAQVSNVSKKLKFVHKISGKIFCTGPVLHNYVVPLISGQRLRVKGNSLIRIVYLTTVIWRSY